MKYTLILVCLLFFLPLYAETKHNFDYETINSFENNGHESVISSFQASSEHKSSRLQVTFNIRKSKKFIGKFLLLNTTSHPITYEIICLLNYKQQTCNSDKPLSKKIKLIPKQKYIIPVMINSLSKGSRDFIIMAVRIDIENFYANAKFPVLAVDFAIISHRANLVVGISKKSNTKYKILKNIENNEDRFTNIVINNKEGIDQFMPLRNLVMKDERPKIQHYLHISNYNKISTNYALVIFANNKQISYISGRAEKISYYRLQRKSVAKIPISITNNNELNNIWAVSIDNPYMTLEPTSGNLSDNSMKVRISNLVHYL